VEFSVYLLYHGGMFGDELKDLIIKVITSWQVIVVTIVIFTYLVIVNRASRSHYKRRAPPSLKPLKSKKEEPSAEEDVDDSGLGLDE